MTGMGRPKAGPAFPHDEIPQPVTHEEVYATRLAKAIWEKHWKEEAPGWMPLHDLLGLLTQIDNMTAGLVRASSAVPYMLAALKEVQQWDERGCGTMPSTLAGFVNSAIAKAEAPCSPGNQPVPSERDIATAIYVALSGCGALTPEIDDPTRECRIAARAVTALLTSG